MRRVPRTLHAFRIRHRLSAAGLLVLAAAVLPSVTPGSASAEAGATGSVAATATSSVEPVPAATLRETGSALDLTVPAAAGAPGYTLRIDQSPFRITTLRGGGRGQTVLATTAGQAGSSGPTDFRTAAGWAAATAVRHADWANGVLDLTLATTAPGDTVDYRITPAADRYRTTWSIAGPEPATQVAAHYSTASAGHWYGQGETPNSFQPWPLDSAAVRDTGMAPAEYLMTEPFWFTQRGSGLWVDTHDVMDVSMNSLSPGVFGYTLTDSSAMDATVFVERTARDVYQDYLGITGPPAQVRATKREFAQPLWNTWAQFYTSVTEDGVLSYARGLHDAGVPAQAIQVDDGWMTHYGDFAFNSKFPTPKTLSERIHALGDKFGLWVTLWINNDADDYAYAAQHGYLLRSRSDPSKPCSVTWWNGTAGIVDLANPAALAWYTGQLKKLQQTYGVDGFKFDTRFFDESCAPYPGHSALDYLTLGARLTSQFDQQGAGVRIHWTGSQRYGFVTRQVDKGTGWPDLRSAVAQNLAISTVGYPFVETDMIGGSLGEPPPTEQVLVRWAEAASAMPLMYSSTSPLGVRNPYGSRSYDRQTVRLYTAAVKLHERLAPYVQRQVARALRSGEPIMKPLFFDFPGDRAGYTVSDEWLLGDDLLAAPVLADADARSVHLPPGRWYDTLHHRVLTGPADLPSFSAGLARTPLFVRLGTRDTGPLIAAITSAPSSRS